MSRMHELSPTANDVAIIGMHCRFPGVAGIEAFERILREGVNLTCPRLVQENGHRRVELHTAVDDMAEFDADFFNHTPAEASVMDPQQRLFLEAAWELFEQAGYVPGLIAGKVGAFAGVSTSLYLLRHLLNDDDIIRRVGDLQVMIGNDKDHLTSEVAYKLDLNGPCITVQASCATSLVAVHLACESLISHQSDMALAGGITLRLPDQQSYQPSGDGLLSQDGLIHAFDAGATGTVYSSGLALVLLKRAKEAVAAGDRIYALITGSAINNDGRARAGYTAPGVDGQAQVIAEAQSLAGMAPGRIAVVETHGSGTPLGDAIEVAALKRGFGRNGPLPRRSCAIGSVKTNIGHVEMAAGAAGLIKAALSVQHGVLYPSLNFSQPNPELGLDDSPFYVNDRLAPWPAERPRIAGVSSFGLGGSNAHVILRQGPPRPRRRRGSGPELVVFSARTPAALARMEANLLRWIDNHRDAALADVAFTLQVGRSQLPVRKAVVVDSLAALAPALAAAPLAVTSERSVAWLLRDGLVLEEASFRQILRARIDLTSGLSRLVATTPDQLAARWALLSPAQRSFVSTSALGAFSRQLCPDAPRCILSEGTGDAAAAVLTGANEPLEVWKALLDGRPIAAGLGTIPWYRARNGGWVAAETEGWQDTAPRSWADLVRDLELQEVTWLVMGAADSELDGGMQAAICTGVTVGRAGLLAATRDLWLTGAQLDWRPLSYGRTGQRIELPGTVFEKRKHWIDLQREPAPRLEAPPTAPEAAVKEIWEGALGREVEDPEASFFELGGHSLLAARILQEIRTHLQVELPLTGFFAEPTLAGVGRRVAELAQSGSGSPLPSEPVFAPESAHQPFPLTDVQQAYWIGRSESLGLGSVATHIYSEYEFDELDLPRFERALNQVIRRHPMLRAVIEPNGTQRILEHVPEYRIPVTPTQARGSEAFAREVASRRAEMSHQVLDVSRWPLFDMRAVQASDGSVRLHVSFDLLVADAWSLELFKRDMSRLYFHPDEPLRPLEYSFRDYVLTLKGMEASPQYERSRAYWQERVAALPPAPRLPLRLNPEQVGHPTFVRRRRKLGGSVWRRIVTQAAQLDMTPTTVLLACFSEVLARWSESGQFTLNLTLFNRLPLHADIDEVIGDFTSLTLLAVDRSRRESFSEAARRIQARMWQDLDHRWFNGVQVSRLLARERGDPLGAVFPVVFTSLLGQERAQWGDRRALPRDDLQGVSQTPQVWLDHQVLEVNGELHLNWDVVEELFEPGVIERAFSAYCDLLERLATDEELWESDSPLQLGAVAAAVEMGSLPSGRLEDGLRRWAAAHGEAAAVLSPAAEVSFAAVDRAAEECGRRLLRDGLERGERVAVMMEKSWQQVAAVHGVLRAGGAYVPIDPDLPRLRRDELLRDAGVRRWLTQPWLVEELAAHGSAVVVEDGFLERTGERLAEPAASGGDLAYVIYTSGSTGRPKGVMIEHGAALNTIVDVNRRFALASADRVLGLSSLSFDLSVYDVFGPAAVGAALVLPAPAGLKDPRHWGELLRQHRVTVWNSVPSLLRMLTEFAADGEELFPSLRLALLSGDWIPLGLPAEARARLNRSLEVVSLGGATECSIWSILEPVGVVDPSWTSIPYGTGMTNQPVYVLNERLEECPPWVVGEIHIGGAGLARGYLGDAERTAQQFIRHPASGERLYRTGDLGRYLPDGRIEICGRRDHQVKINGHRVEPGEIEQKLQLHPSVAAAAVITPGEPQRRRLVAFVVPRQATEAGFSYPESVLTDPGERLAFKLHQKGVRRDLNSGPALSRHSSADSYIKRRSYRNFEEKPVSEAQLGGLLSALSQWQFESLPFPKYLYGSAGGLYPVQTYVEAHSAKVAGLQQGLYYYDPRHHQLQPIRLQVGPASELHVPANRALAERAAFSLYFVAELDAIVPMYGHDAGWLFSVMEAGAMCQLLEETAAEHGLGLCQCGMANAALLAERLELRPSQRYLHCAVGGYVSASQHDEAALRRDFSTYEKRPEEKAAAGGSPLDLAATLRKHLSDQLPSYMVPDRIDIVRELPLTDNAKIDRRQLERWAQQHGATAEVAAPETADEESRALVLSLWRDALGRTDFDARDNFFSLGGSSIELVAVRSGLERHLQREIPIVDLFRLPTAESVAAYVAALRAGNVRALPASPADDPGETARAEARRQALTGRRQRGGTS